MDILAIIISVITFMVSLTTVLVVYILYNKLKEEMISRIAKESVSICNATTRIKDDITKLDGRARRNTQALWDKIREVENKISIPNNPPKDKSKKELTFIPHEE